MDEAKTAADAISGGPTWGIVYGAILAVLVGVAGTLFQEWRTKRNQRRVVLEFAADIIDTFEKIFDELDTYKKQTGIVWINILDKMLEEYPVYSRNREHIIHIKDRDLRRDIHDMMLRLTLDAGTLKAAVQEEIKWQTELLRPLNEPDKKYAENEKVKAHSRIEEKYTALKDTINKAKGIRSRLQ